MIKIERLKSDRSIACVQFYQHVITDTPDMDQYGRWKIGLYPTEQDIANYIDKGAMYGLSKDDVIIGAMAVTMEQGNDYHAINWSLPLADSEVAVIHVLAVDPDYQGKGFGEKLVEEAISIARANGKRALRLDALASNAPAHRLYAKKGFVYRGMQSLHAANTGRTDFFFFELEI